MRFNRQMLFQKGNQLGKLKTGVRQSPEHIAKRRAKQIGQKRTVEQRKRISDALKGKKMSEKARKNMRLGQLGKKRSIEHRINMSLSKKGVPTYNWKGGTSRTQDKLIRHSLEYKLWREAVFKRDNYTCVWCGERSRTGKAVIIQADHIKPFSLYPELRFALDNGRTLCRECHSKTDTYKGRIWKVKK